MSPETPSITILAYHDILPPGSPPNGFDGSIPLDRLIDHFEKLEKAGYGSISLGQAFHRLVEAPGDGGKYFTATFDDGYESLIRYLPGLLGSIRPTIFVITGEVGKRNFWNMRSPVKLRHLSLNQLRQLVDMGVDLEFHGTTHGNVVKFSDEELKENWGRGIAWFEKKMGRKPDFLAYPYGFCNERVMKVAAQFFRGALSVNHGAWSGEGARFALNRISVPFYLSGEDMVSIIETPPENRWFETERRAPWRKSQPQSLQKERSTARQR